MKRLFFFLIICIFKVWVEKAKASKFISFKRKRNASLAKVNHLNNRENTIYSFVVKKENEEEKEDKEHNYAKKDKEGDENSLNSKKNEENNQNEKKHEEESSNEKKREEESSSEKKHEEENSSEKKHKEENPNEKRHEEENPNEKKREEESSNEKKREGENSNEKNEENNSQKKDESLIPEKKINKNNLLEYGTHDKNGNFIPSYKTLTDEILSTNNALDRASKFLNISCSHIMKLIEFIPESKQSSQSIKVDSKTMYIKDIGTECQNVYFSLEKLSMSITVLNSKIHKLIYIPDK